MKTCKGCKYAEWDKTKTERLHPSGDGKCTYPFKTPTLPQSMYWLGREAPMPNGGMINRRTTLKDHCAYYGT